MKLRLVHCVILSSLLGSMLLFFLMRLNHSSADSKLVISPYKYEVLKCKVQMDQTEQWQILLKHNSIICGKGEDYKTIPYARLTEKQKNDVDAFDPFTK
jgi:hypothetical protein